MTVVRVATTGALVLVVAVIAWSLLRPVAVSTGLLPGGATDLPDESVATALARVANSDGTSTLPGFVTGLEALPASLHGTEIDGQLRADASGRLIIGSDVRRVFDWFLSALGEESLAVIVARLHAHFEQVLPPSAAAEARALLANYLGYREALAAIDAPTVAPGEIDLLALRARQAEAQALRKDFFSADVAAIFYADDDAWDEYALARLSVLQRVELSPQQQAIALAELHETLPPALQESVKATSQYQDLQALTGDWEQRGGSAAELRQIRENLLGAEAADRLETLDAQRQDWDRRLAGWWDERRALLANDGLAAADRASEITRRRAQRFAPEDIARVQALEHLHDQD